jgi:hypothetical protein
MKAIEAANTSGRICRPWHGMRLFVAAHRGKPVALWQLPFLDAQARVVFVDATEGRTMALRSEDGHLQFSTLPE